MEAPKKYQNSIWFGKKNPNVKSKLWKSKIKMGHNEKLLCPKSNWFGAKSNFNFLPLH